jgi:succinate-acetate transporter protein
VSSIADARPLGLFAFGLTWFIVSLLNVGVSLGTGGSKVVLSLALVYGGLTMLLAGMWAFRAGNTFSATVATSYGAFWLSYVVLMTPGLFGISNAAVTYKPLGIFLLGWAVISAFFAIASFRSNGAQLALYVLVFLTLLLLGVAQLIDNDALTAIGGWLGILTALVAGYTALAGLLLSVSRGTITLPIYPLG